MKRIALIAAAGLIFFGSCKKDDLDPVTGFDSKITFSGIRLYNVQFTDTVIGRLYVNFTDQNDSIIKNIQSNFYIVDPQSDQTVHFNTPANPKAVTFGLSFDTDGGSMDSVHVTNVSYIRNEKTLINQPGQSGSQAVSYTF